MTPTFCYSAETGTQSRVKAVMVFGVHHVLAHPLLAVYPRLGLWLHMRTIAAHDYTFCG